MAKDPWTATEVSYEPVSHLRSRAARDRVVVTQTRSRSRWVVVRLDDGTIIGVGGLIFHRTGRARLKGLWVDPAHRKRGVMSALCAIRVEIAQEECVSMVEAFALSPGWYLANGFTLDRVRGDIHILRRRL